MTTKGKKTMTDKLHFDDLTQITCPFGVLDEDTQKRLREWPHAVQLLGFNGWEEVRHPAWCLPYAYRAKPTQVTPLVVKDWSMLADWVRYVARDRNGSLWGYSDKPVARGSEWAESTRENIGTDIETLRTHSFAMIDPGTCDWREAIDCRDNPNNGSKA